VAKTDAKGRFTLEGLIPGQAYEVNLRLDAQFNWRVVTRVQPKSATPSDLGDLHVDPEPLRPYVPPTPAERSARAFAAQSASPRQRMSTVLAESAREHTRPVLLFGQPKDPACIELFRLFAQEPPSSGSETDQPRAKRPPTPYDLRWELELASLDTEKPEVRTFVGEIGVAAGKGRPPVLAVLNADGALAATSRWCWTKRKSSTATR
jgi:hypothetical protein